MKRSRLIIPLVALATMALMLSATGATADVHTTLGTSSTDCDVDGTVTLESNNNPGGGLDNIPGSNHYRFTDTTLECEGKKGGTYDVLAEGDTADFFHQLHKKDDPSDPDDPPLGAAGEDCEQGGSIAIDNDGNGVNDEVHSGILSAEEISGSGSPNKAGLVHFVRVGTTVLADGPLWDGTLTVPDKPRPEPSQWFQAELEFIPGSTECSKANPIRTAQLIGEAQLYNEWIHDCGLDDENGKENGKGHCDI